MDRTNVFLDTLTPTQEHFLKKFLIEKRLENELSLLNEPECLQLFGDPFKSTKTKENKRQFPLLNFFFKNYVSSFPFITNNTDADQLKFWQDTVQPFVESINAKHLSNSNDRKEHVTKRKQINRKFLSGLSLFYNSMIVTDKDMVYLESDHLRPSDVGKLDKLKSGKTPMLNDVSYTKEVQFHNGMSIDVVAVDQVNTDNPGGLKNWLGYGNTTTHHFEFVIEVVRQSPDLKCYVSRPYHEFKRLEKALAHRFPGIMNIATTKLPEKFKHDANTLVKEKLRISLRGYLTQLIKVPDIVNSVEFQSFLMEDSYSELSESQVTDYKTRQEHEKRIIATQFEFQKQVSKIMIDFTKNFDDFKAKLIEDPNTLVRIFEEIGEKSEMKDLSPLLKIFIEWCKIETSATIFQVFLTQDNSNELLNNFRKFHRLFPYTVMYNILRFTNPMGIISKVINLMLITLPGTNKTLLSMIFIMLLDDDLNGYETEIKEVKSKLEQYPNFIKQVEDFVDNKFVDNDLDIDEHMDEIIWSQKKHNEGTNFTKAESKYMNDPKGVEVINNLKQLYQLRIRENDKLILKTMWQEPEITKLLKNFLIIFYQPLIKLLSRSNMHIFFKEFRRFADDLITLLVKLNEEEVYYLTSMEIFNKLMNLVDEHIITFWTFIHDLYNNDQDQLFVNLIKWIENFLLKLRLKYVDIDKVKINLNMQQVDIDEQAFLAQLNERIDKVLLKRKLFKDHYTSTEKDSGNSIDKNWDQLHETLNEYDQEFGLDIEQLQELNYEMNNTDLEFQKQLEKLDTLNHGTSELDKFDDYVAKQLTNLLDSI